jgi:hypothetical protein
MMVLRRSCFAAVYSILFGKTIAVVGSAHE